jgi:pimeloyl-ACP methyl ester carboxylesterase
MTEYKSIATDHGEITCLEAGAGSPLVLLHGIGSGAASWQAQLDGFADRYRVIAWDAPGYGGSAPLEPTTPDARDYAAALAGFLDALGVDICHLVGHSLGALIACAFTQRWPERVKSLMIADPAAGYATANPAVRAERMAARLGVLDRLGPEGMANERSGVLLSETASEDTRKRVRDVMARIRPDGYRQAVAMLSGGDIHVDARRISLPVQVVCGGDDTVTPPAGCENIAASFPNAQFEILPGLGHASYVEGPDAFNAVLADHLSAKE